MEIKITDQINNHRSLGVYAINIHPDVLRFQCNDNENSFIEVHYLASFLRNFAMNKMQISYL